jgi:riboflavin biosynthesis pyrimidine reductase
MDFISELNKKINTLELNEHVKQELFAEIQTIKAQSESPKPKNSILRESLSSIRNILEGAGGNIAASLLLQKLADLISFF